MNWNKEKISSFAEVTTGGTPSTDKREYWDRGKIPWLNSGDLNQGIVTQASNFITEEGYKNSSTKLMPPNTVLIALTGATTGLAAILKIEACANQSVTGIFPSEKHYPEFLYYFLRTQRKRILDAAWGGAQPHINQKYVKDYEVPLPSLAEQIKIATVLSKAEALIRQRKENIDLLDEFLKSTFLKMFGDPVKNDKSWEINSLANYGSLKNGLNYTRNEAGVSIRCLGVGDFKDLYKLTDIESLPILNLTSKPSGDYFLKNGDLVFVRSNGNRELVGRCIAIYPNQHEVTFSGFCIRYRPENNSLDSTYLSFLFRIPKFRAYMLRGGKGANIQNINQKTLESLKIPIPPIELQNQFATVVEKTEALKEQLKNSLHDVENLYASLSQKAFKGELNINNKRVIQSIEDEITRLEYSRSIGMQAMSDGVMPEEALESFERTVEELTKEIKYKEEQINILLGGESTKEKQSTTKKEDILIAPEQEAEDKRYGDPFEVDEETAKKQGTSFYEAWKNVHTPKEKSKILWETVSVQQVSNWIKEKYSGHHFSSEMLLRFLQEEQLTTPYYFSSEELKKFPKYNSLDDLHTLIFSAVNGENPYLKLKQVFYNGTEKTFSLNLSEEDIEMTIGRNDEQMTGIYFTIE